MLGFLKSIEIPAEKLDKALDNEIIFDGSITGFSKINDADMYFYPDLNTWLILEMESKKRI